MVIGLAILVKMLGTIQFHNKMFLWAVEVHHISSKHLLAAKWRRKIFQKIVPQVPFFFCHAFSQSLCKFSHVLLRQILHLRFLECSCMGINRRISYAKPVGHSPSPGGEGVTSFGVTDEVEGRNFVPTYGDNRSLRPHQSALAGCQLPLQGKPLLRGPKVTAFDQPMAIIGSFDLISQP